MELGELPAEADAPVFAKDLGEILQRGGELVGRLIEDHGALLSCQGAEVLLPALAVGGEETLEGEPSGGKPRDAQGRDDGAGAGDGADGHTGCGALRHQCFAGVGNGGRAGVGDQRAGLAVQKAL